MSTDTTLTVSTATLLTISTGRFLADSFDDFHHAADVLMGQALMTHQFASDRVAEQMCGEATRQHPWLADVDHDSFPAMTGVREQDEQACREWVAGYSAEHGNEHVIVTPPETRHVPLLEGLPVKFGGEA